MNFNRLFLGGLLFLCLGFWDTGIQEVKGDDCYEAWSRCTGWSSSATGVLWKSCAGRCQLCKGRESGQCVSGDFGCGATEQCQCSGGNIAKSDSWWNRWTCYWGL